MASRGRKDTEPRALASSARRAPVREWFHPRYLYPVAFALWPALSLYATNVDHYRLPVLVRPIVASATVALLLYGILAVVLRRPALAAFKAFCALLAFLVGGLVCRAWRGITVASVPMEFSAVAAVVTLGLVLLALWARPPHRFHRLPEVLWVFSLTLLALPLATVVRSEHTRARISLPRAAGLELGVLGEDAPHIIYLVLDGYWRAPSPWRLVGRPGPWRRGAGAASSPPGAVRFG